MKLIYIYIYILISFLIATALGLYSAFSGNSPLLCSIIPVLMSGEEPSLSLFLYLPLELKDLLLLHLQGFFVVHLGMSISASVDRDR